MGLATAALAALGTAAGIGIASINRGSEVDDISSAFDNLAKKAGGVSDVLLNDLNNALGHTVSNFNIMKQANELLIGGLKPDEITLVAEAARALGEQTGVSATEGMNALADSLLRGNDRALKSLGIIIDNTKAEADFAKSIGTTSDKLNEAGKVEALRIASLQALADQKEKFGKVTNDAADSLAQFNKFLGDAKDKFTVAIANNKELNDALSNLAKSVQNINFEQFAETIAGAAKVVINFAADAIPKLIEGLSVVAKVIKAIPEEIERLKRGLNELARIVGTPFDKLQAIGDEIQKDSAYAKMVRSIHDAEKESIKAATFFSTSISSIKDAAKSGFDFIGDAAKNAGVSISYFTETVGPQNFIGPMQQVAEVTAKASDGFLKTEDAIKKVKEAAIEIPKILAGSFGDSSIATPTILDVKRIDKKDYTSAGLEIGAALAQGILDGMSTDLNAKSVTSILGNIGSAAASAFGAPEFAPFIQIGSEFLGNFIDSIFGGESAGLTARKAADRFFADAFDANRLAVVIDDQLKVIDDLVFKGDTLFGGNVDFTNSSFSNFLASLPGEAQAAFNGVGAAFEELLGIGEDVGGQLAAVFANNVGGSLNNLQLLVQSTGKSFEELEGAVVTAFEDGRLSALEAQTALNGLAQVAQKGIPDGIGFTVQAFKNLEAAGTKGGRTAVDALQDIAFEAKEIGIKDFPALAANLAASGQFTADEIQKLFDSLKANGITSIDQLTKATTQQLIPVLANLQAKSFPFKEAADSAATFVEQINSLPDSKTITLNVRTNIDDAGRQLLNANSGSGSTFNNTRGLGNSTERV